VPAHLLSPRLVASSRVRPPGQAFPRVCRAHNRWVNSATLRRVAHFHCATSASAQRGCPIAVGYAARTQPGHRAPHHESARSTDDEHRHDPCCKGLTRSMAADSLEATEERTCTDCGARAPTTQTNYTLISASHGWRLASRPGGAGQKPVLEWRCPGCWLAYRTAGGKLRPAP
jgi:hypothetical protein